MKNSLIILSLISFLFLASSCPKKDGGPSNLQTKKETLPPITQDGANTFGCLVNGKVWLPYRTDGHPSLNVQYYQGQFLLSVNKDSGTETSQGIYQIMEGMTWSYKPVYGTGTYYFKSAPGGGSPGAEFVNNSCNFWSDNRDSLNTYVTITKLDSINRIISGTFNLVYIPSINETLGNCDTIKITNGRFDAIYYY